MVDEESLVVNVVGEVEDQLDEEYLVVNVVGEVEDQLVRFNLNPKPATDSVWLRPQANSVHRLVFNVNLNMILI